MTYRPKPLQYCYACKEDSCKTKLFNRKSDGKRMKLKYCLNKGCGYRIETPVGLVNNMEIVKFSDEVSV